MITQAVVWCLLKLASGDEPHDFLQYSGWMHCCQYTLQLEAGLRLVHSTTWCIYLPTVDEIGQRMEQPVAASTCCELLKIHVLAVLVVLASRKIQPVRISSKQHIATACFSNIPIESSARKKDSKTNLLYIAYIASPGSQTKPIG